MDHPLLASTTQVTLPHPQHRPRTSKPRGICRYYETPRGCFAGDHCKFLHGKPPEDAEPSVPPLLSPYDQAKKCKYYIQGYCKRGDTCWFRHVSNDGPSSSSATVESDDEDSCSICLEKATTFGLLGGCSHVFCIACIRQWRDPQNRTGGGLDPDNTKKCPMCRTPSKFITPSSGFYRQGTEEKEKVVNAYKESMARVPCKYFQKSLKNKKPPMCPYGKDCFYQHKNEDGTDFVFDEGVEVSMRRYRNSTSQPHFLRYIPFSFEPSDIPFPLDAIPGSFLDGDRRLQQQVSAVRRLRDVRDMLTDALNDSAPLDNLHEAMEALRNGLGRLEDLNITQPARQPGQDDDEVTARHEDEVMSHLELMADQMLTALNALGGREGGRGWGSDSPPPLELAADGTPNVDILHEDGYSTASTVSSMPALQSVSNSSSDVYEEGEDDGNESDVDLPANDEPPRQREFLRPREAAASSSSSELDLRTRRSPSPTDSDEISSALACQPQVQLPSASGSSSADANAGGSREQQRSGDAPFVTDGRGRVVGTSTGEERKIEEGQEGWIGWFTSLF